MRRRAFIASRRSSPARGCCFRPMLRRGRLPRRGEFELPTSGNLAGVVSTVEQKKFLLAFGLATQARLVLLDEPTNGLDIPSKSLLRALSPQALTDDRLFANPRRTKFAISARSWIRSSSFIKAACC